MVKEEKAIKRVWSGWNLLVCCVRGQKGLQQVPDHSNYAQHNTTLNPEIMAKKLK